MMRLTPLAATQRKALEDAAGPDYAVVFFDAFRERFDVARLLWHNARLRLTCPEAYEVHRSVIEWNSRFSIDRIPDQAVGVDPLTARLMRWVMQSWTRVEFFNRYLFGTVMPRVQLDFLPALACAGHVLLRPCRPLDGIEDYVRAGIAMQRLWLTATSLGLHLQPEMTPIIFRWYVQAGRTISVKPEIDRDAARIATRFEAAAGADGTAPFAFFGRVGFSSEPWARSVLKELGDLMVARRE
jgi:hypothetical protein